MSAYIPWNQTSSLSVHSMALLTLKLVRILFFIVNLNLCYFSVSNVHSEAILWRKSPVFDVTIDFNPLEPNDDAVEKTFDQEMQIILFRSWIRNQKNGKMVAQWSANCRGSTLTSTWCRLLTSLAARYTSKPSSLAFQLSMQSYWWWMLSKVRSSSALHCLWAQVAIHLCGVARVVARGYSCAWKFQWNMTI